MDRLAVLNPQRFELHWVTCPPSHSGSTASGRTPIHQRLELEPQRPRERVLQEDADLDVPKLGRLGEVGGVTKARSSSTTIATWRAGRRCPRRFREATGDRSTPRGAAATARALIETSERRPRAPPARSPRFATTCGAGSRTDAHGARGWRPSVRRAGGAPDGRAARPRAFDVLGCIRIGSSLRSMTDERGLGFTPRALVSQLDAMRVVSRLCLNLHGS